MFYFENPVSGIESKKVWYIKKGHQEHLISAASEWLVATLIMFVMLTFTFDFRKIILTKPKVKENIPLSAAGKICYKITN